MKSFSLIYNEKRNAGPKAPRDIDLILSENYNCKNYSIVKNRFYKFNLIFILLKLIFSFDINVIHYPFVKKDLLYKFISKKKTIIFIHDINSLRNKNEENLVREINVLNSFKYIVVHNSLMKDFLIKYGITEDKLFVLSIFDYLADGEVCKKKNFDINNVKVLYPGNLKVEKSPFIFQLDSKKIDFSINLYGLGVENDISHKIVYKGSFEPENINSLEGDLGLIWDGNFDESDEDKSFKNYTKYNNPHKLSCCLALGIPVIVWNKSAVSKFVIENNVGYTISNIYDINNINFSDYNVKCDNAYNVALKLRNGYYTKRVIDSIISKMK